MAPWAFGGTPPRIAWALSLAALAAGAVALSIHRDALQVPRCAWPVLGLLLVCAFQMVPLPPALLRALAPGSAVVWFPGEPAALSVLGSGPRPVSVDPEATRRWLAFAGGVIVLALLAAPGARSRRGARWAVVGTSAAGLLIALYGIAARSLFGNRLYGLWSVPTLSPFGPFVSKNHFAGYVAMAALVALGLAVGLKNDARRASGASWMESRKAGGIVAAFGVSAVMAVAVLVSLSRGGTIGLLAGGIAFLALRFATRRGRATRGLVLGFLGGGLALAVAFAVLPHEAQERALGVALGRRDSSSDFRLGLWRDVLRLSASSPLLGQGLGAFADALPPFKTGAGELRVQHAENDLLELLAEAGVTGIALALASLGLALLGLVRGLRQEGDGLLRGLGLGAGAGLVALLVHSLVDFNLHVPSNALLFAFLASLVVGLAREPRVSVGPALGTGLCLLLAGATLLLLAAPPLAESRVDELLRELKGRSVTPLRMRQLDVALVRHLRGRPGDAEAWAYLGWIRTVAGKTDEGAALARHGARLDPRRTALQPVSPPRAEP